MYSPAAVLVRYQVMKEVRNWKRCKAKIRSLKGRLGFSEEPVLKFLGLSLYLEDGSVYDHLTNCALKQERILSDIYCILFSYADAEPTPEDSKLVTSKQLRGGQYCNVMVQRAKSSIQKVPGSRSKLLVGGAKLLGGTKANFSYGDQSVRINSLPLVSLIIVLSEEDSEFPASAQIFFDQSIVHYLALEQIGMLSGLTAETLKQAYECLDKKREQGEKELFGYMKFSKNQK
jgi:hypothetical protein